MVADEKLRIDRWLWAVRIFKTRPLATKACEAGRVSIDGRTAKPSSPARPGQTIEIRQPDLTRTVRVKAISEKRVGAKLVPGLLEDLTPETEYEKSREFWRQSPARRARGTGRPTKKDRRETDRFFGS